MQPVSAHKALTSAPCYLWKLLYRVCRSHLGEVRSVQSGAATSTPLPAVSRHTQSCDRLYFGVFTSLMASSCLDLFSFKAAPLHLVQRMISGTTLRRLSCGIVCLCESQQPNKYRETITSSEIINLFCFNNLCFNKESVKSFPLFFLMYQQPVSRLLISCDWLSN